MSTETLQAKKRERLDVMLDIESLSTAHNGATIQIAAIPFKIEGSDDEVVMTQFNRLISPKSCIEAGLDVNADTMKWWFSQDMYVQDRVLAKAISQGMALNSVLSSLSNFFKSLEEQAEKVFIWGYPATSDMTWLQNAYIAAKLPYPVAYNRTRCLGSIADLYWEATGKKLSEQATTKINHDALVDCQSQIEMVCLAYKELGYVREGSDEMKTAIEALKEIAVYAEGTRDGWISEFSTSKQEDEKARQEYRDVVDANVIVIHEEIKKLNERIAELEKVWEIARDG